jgi:PAS domain S-box-containing protein
VALRAAHLRAAVRESQQRFQGLVETLSDWIWEIDQNGVYTYVSPKVKDLLGYEPNEVLGKTPFDLMPPEEAQRVAGVLGSRRAAQQPVVAVENTNRHKDGHLVVFETSGVPFFDAEGRFKGYRGTGRDITERKRAEAELTAAREAEQKFLEQLTTLAAVTNELSKAQTLDELCRRSVEAGREKLGFDRIALWFVAEDHTTMLGTYGTDADGQTTDERLSRHLIDPASDLRLIVDGNIALKVYKNAPLYQDGKQIGVGERLAVGLWNGETVIGFLSIDNFIYQQPFTDQDYELLRLYASALGHLWNLKYAQGKLAQLAETLEQRVAERTAQLEAAVKEMEAFSYSVSHDLRAPLRAMNGYSSILLQDYASQLTPEAARYLTAIRDNAKQMSDLIEDLLAFSRLSRQPLHKQSIDTADLVRQALQSLSGEQVGRRIETSMGELPACQGDPALLRQVWINLLLNALKFTREQNVARIEIGCLTQEDGAPVYFVKDNGVGFDMRYAGKLFGVFQRLHRAEEYEGTGVGLAIVQRIIHRHGGRVWAEGAMGQGATFYFTLSPQKE